MTQMQKTANSEKMQKRGEKIEKKTSKGNICSAPQNDHLKLAKKWLERVGKRPFVSRKFW